MISTCSPCRLSRDSILDSILCNNEAFAAFFNAPFGSANAQSYGPRGNLNIDLQSMDLIWATKDIFSKITTILEFSYMVWLSLCLKGWSASFFFIWIKKTCSSCSPNQISINFLIAASPTVSTSKISFVTFSFATTPVDIHINRRGLKGSMNDVSGIPKILSTASWSFFILDRFKSVSLYF